jgi:hypothetical protein
VVVDGAILGAIFGGRGGWEGALLWGGLFALGGGVLGGLAGAVGWAVFPRMVLRPPGEDEDD